MITLLGSWNSRKLNTKNEKTRLDQRSQKYRLTTYLEIGRILVKGKDITVAKGWNGIWISRIRSSKPRENKMHRKQITLSLNQLRDDKENKPG